MNRSWCVLIGVLGAGVAIIAAPAVLAGRGPGAPPPSHGLSSRAAGALAPGIVLSVAHTPVYCDIEGVAISRGWLQHPTSGCPVAREAAESAALLARNRGRVAETVLMRASWSDGPRVVRDRLVWVVVVKDGALTWEEWGGCDPLGPGVQTLCPSLPDTLDRVYLVDASSARVLIGVTIDPPGLGS
jgi:hypothetical protein